MNGKIKTREKGKEKKKVKENVTSSFRASLDFISSLKVEFMF